MSQYKPTPDSEWEDWPYWVDPSQDELQGTEPVEWVPSLGVTPVTIAAFMWGDGRTWLSYAEPFMENQVERFCREAEAARKAAFDAYNPKAEPLYELRKTATEVRIREEIKNGPKIGQSAPHKGYELLDTSPAPLGRIDSVSGVLYLSCVAGEDIDPFSAVEVGLHDHVAYMARAVPRQNSKTWGVERGAKKGERIRAADCARIRCIGQDDPVEVSFR